MKHLVYIVSIFILLCFDFVWLGGIIPIWIFLTGVIILLNLYQINYVLTKILSKEVKKIIFYFFLYTIYILTIKLFSDLFDFQYAVGIISLVSFIMFIIIGYNVKTKELLLVVCFSILIHGFILNWTSIRLSWAWNFVDSLMSNKDSLSIYTSDVFNERYHENA